EYKLKLCEDAYDLATADGRAKYVKAALRVVAGLSDEAEREVYLDIINKKSGVSVTALRSSAANIKPETAPAPPVRGERTEKESVTVMAARFVLNMIAECRDDTSPDDIEPEWLPLPEQAEVLR